MIWDYIWAVLQEIFYLTGAVIWTAIAVALVASIVWRIVDSVA